MMIWIAAYIGAALAMLVLDSLWLGFAAKRLYRPELGDILAEGFRIAPAAIFYLSYVAGIVFLAVAPALSSGDWKAAAVRGAALGAVCYATYDLTNQATLRHWSTLVTVSDIAWGTILTATAASVGFVAANWAKGAL